MSSIHENAFSGTLNSSLLQEYLQDDPSCLNAVSTIPGGPKASMTPLCLAVVAGKSPTVSLLLRETPPNSIDVERGSSRYTPLFYAITRTPPHVRNHIVNVLLDAGANIHNCSTDEDDFTPLMYAISVTRDRDLIHTLVDRDLQLNVKEQRGGKTAETLAREAGLEKEILPKGKRFNTQGENIYWFFACAMVIFAYLKTALGGIVKELLEVPQVRQAVKTATDRFNTDMTIALKDIGQHIEKTSGKILDTQKQAHSTANSKKPSTKAKPAATRQKVPVSAASSVIPPASAMPSPAVPLAQLPAQNDGFSSPLGLKPLKSTPNAPNNLNPSITFMVSAPPEEDRERLATGSALMQ